MRYDRRVIGYHACADEIANLLLLGDEPFKPSRNHGIGLATESISGSSDISEHSIGLRSGPN